jgi:hypothetical protein
VAAPGLSADARFVMAIAGLGVTTRMPFDVLVEGRFLRESGENRTPIELLVEGVRSWEADLRRFLDTLTDGK